MKEKEDSNFNKEENLSLKKNIEKIPERISSNMKEVSTILAKKQISKKKFPNNFKGITFL